MERGSGRLKQALPGGFEFYHLGEVFSGPERDQAPPISPLASDLAAVSFVVRGELQGLMLVFFEQGLEESMYVEMGNVMASRFADRLSQQEGRSVMISPPKVLSPEQAEALLRSQRGKLCFHRSYVHLHAGAAIKLEALVYPRPEEDVLHV